MSCLNLQTQRCCQPRPNKHTVRLISLASAHSTPLRSGNAPTPPFRSSLAVHRWSSSPSHRLVTTYSGLFDQAWGASIDVETLNQTLPQDLFAVSLFPYLGFLYHLTKSKKTPPITLFGFYFLLVFVFGTIPAGIYAKNVYETSLANVDYLHGSAEFLLTLTNLFIVLGLRKAIREAESKNAANSAVEGSKATNKFKN